jgi:hypothetical protein
MRVATLIAAIVCGLLLLFAGCTRSEPEAAVVAVMDEPSPPRLQISRPTRDLGQIPLSPLVERFEVRNTGQEPLVIHRLEKSCGCVDVQLDETTIPAAATAVLEVRIAPRQPEEQSASVTLHSNDPLAEAARIVLTWTARGAVAVDVGELQFGIVRPGVTASRRVHITQDLQQLDAERDFRISGQPPGLFTARRMDVKRTETTIDEEWQIDLLVDHQTVETSGRLSVADPSDPVPLAWIQASWTVREAIDVTPRTLFLGSAAPRKKVSLSVNVSSDEGEMLEVASARHVGDAISVEVEVVVLDLQTARVDVEATLPEKPGTYLELLHIICSKPFEKEIEIPLACVVLDQPSSAVP